MEQMFELRPSDGRKSFHGKAVVISDADGLTLFSYGTPVITYHGENKVTRLWSGYSVTTMRHVNAFMVFFCSSLCGGKKWWDSLPVGEAVTLSW